MHWIDWCITLIPLTIIIGLAIYARRYIRGVVDYIAVGRVAGRYVISVGDMEAALSVLSLVALVGSSKSSTSGFIARALMMAIRCF